jgi:hypothetical protein
MLEHVPPESEVLMLLSGDDAGPEEVEAFAVLAVACRGQCRTRVKKDCLLNGITDLIGAALDPGIRDNFISCTAGRTKTATMM